MVTERVVSTPITVFIGLGTPVGVLEESASLILEKLSGSVKIYQVDPSPIDESSIIKKLGLSDDYYLQMSWCEFMNNLANRLLIEQRADLEQSCKDQIEEHGWDV